MRTKAGWTILALGLLLCACGSGEDDGTAGTAGSGGASGAGASGGGAGAAGVAGISLSPECEGVEPGKLMKLPEGFSIDATEVTKCQYELWLTSNPSTDDQSAVCSQNNGFVPTCDWPPNGDGDHPVACVDWCDAYAYCKAVGKRLCGKIGGGANGYDDYDNATRSQWYAACSSGGALEYPYGDAYDPQACNGGDNDATGCDHGACTTVVAGSMSSCRSHETGYSGVYDLSGNVWEWEDSCDGDDGSSDLCRVRGGANNYGAVNLGCAYADYFERGVSELVGFRCCSSP